MVKVLTTDEFIERFNNTETSKYFDIIGEYITSRKPIKVRCKTCGKEYLYNQATQLLAYTRKGCPDCRKENIEDKSLSLNDINKKIENRGFICIEYTNAHTLALCTCMGCGRKFQKIINNLKSFRPGKCKYCLFCQGKASHGEKIIATILDNLGIEYIYNQSLPIDNSLHYDFILYNQKLIIEVDGAFHRDTRYKKCNNFFGKDYNKSIAYDRKKDDNARKNGYNIVRIKYNNNKLGKFFVDIVTSLNNYININDVKLSLIDLFCLHQ